MTRGTTNVPSCYVLLERDNKILLILREHTGYMDGYYTLPAGHVEAGESFRQAAVREVKEEVDVVVEPHDLEHVHTLHRKGDADGDVRVDGFFVAAKWQGEPRNAEPDKHSKLQWFHIGNLPKNLMPYQQQALENISKRIAYGETGWNEQVV
jgi:8-oxo-dGTP diphosphatase